MESKPQVYIGAEILEVLPLADVTAGYNTVMRRLHREAFAASEQELQTLLTSETELIVLVVLDKTVVATAQATLNYTLPTVQALLANIVTHPDYGGRGLGRLVVESVEQAACERWSKLSHKPFRIFLTNSPKKGNDGFYEALGYKARTEANNDLTVVWRKVV